MEHIQQEPAQMTTACRTDLGIRQYKCEVCHDTGWILEKQDVADYGREILFAKPCERCRAQRRLSDITGVPAEYSDNDISKIKWDIYGRDLSKLQRICEDFVFHYQDRWAKANKGIYLWSSVCGSGKTHIITALMRSVMIKYDIQARFILTADYINMIGDRIRRQQIDDLTAVYRTCDLLVIDDIGTGKTGDWQIEQMFRLINTRTSNGLITLYTSNCAVGELATVDERCKSRILRNSVVLQMPEVSIRNQQAQEQQSKFLADIIGR